MIDEQQTVRTLLAEQVRLLGYIQSIVRNADLADDVFQDVCVLAVRKRAHIKDETHLRNWLRKTARFEALNAVRRRRVDHLSLDPAVLDVLDQRWQGQDQVDSSAYRELLRQCIGRLSQVHQSLVRKRFFEKLDYGRLAAEFNRSADSLYVTFSRIYATLGKCVAERSAAEPGARHG